MFHSNPEELDSVLFNLVVLQKTGGQCGAYPLQEQLSTTSKKVDKQ